MIETNINVRWQNGTPHHTKSIELFKKLMDIDLEFGGDYFYWKKGGDGDNGETMMYEMDIMFEREDEEKKFFVMGGEKYPIKEESTCWECGQPMSHPQGQCWG